MTRVRVAGFSISLDGFGAGPEQSLENPLGKRGLELHQWFFGTRTFRAMHVEGGSDGVDEAYAHRSMDGFGAFILGRNMFGPIRGPWPDETWKGWWGNNPPYHAPTFVLTHYPRDPIEMDGGTTFIFVTDGIEAALEKAETRCRGLRREDRRWCRDGASISSRRPNRRTAFRLVAGRARARRSDVRRDRPAGARLPCHRTSGDRARHPHRSQPIGRTTSEQMLQRDAFAT